jgi:hypothetical protein
VAKDSYEYPYDNKPICFVQAFDLTEELHNLGDKLLDVLRAERNCEERYLYSVAAGLHTQGTSRVK